MTSVLLELLRHKTWATLALIEFCQKLTAGQLELTTPGTYGSVRGTLHHLVTSEERYQSLMTGKTAGAALSADSGLGALAERIRVLAPHWEALAEDPGTAARQVTSRMGTATGAIVLGQAIHHADDHRTQVASILGAQGTEPPDLDFWAYGQEAGFVHRAEGPDPTAR